MAVYSEFSAQELKGYLAELEYDREKENERYVRKLTQLQDECNDNWWHWTHRIDEVKAEMKRREA